MLGKRKTFSFSGGGNCPPCSPAMYGPDHELEVNACVINSYHECIQKYLNVVFGVRKHQECAVS